jgi:transposase
MGPVGERRRPYPSDLTDEQWALLQPLLTKASGPGQPPNVDLREVVNTLLYLKPMGCQWRYLPHDLLPRSTGFYYFEIVSRLPAQHGFAVLPRRWVVERTLAWLTQGRRLVRDYGAIPPTAKPGSGSRPSIAPSSISHSILWLILPFSTSHCCLVHPGHALTG